MTRRCLLARLIGALLAAASPVTITIDSAMAAPRWARLERQPLAANGLTCREFSRKYNVDRL